MNFIKKLFKKYTKVTPIDKEYILNIVSYPTSEELMNKDHVINLGKIKIKRNETLGILTNKIKNKILHQPNLTEDELCIQFYIFMGTFSINLAANHYKDHLVSNTQIKDNMILYITIYHNNKNSKEKYKENINDQYKQFTQSNDPNKKYPFDESIIKYCLDKQWYDLVEDLHQMNCPWTYEDKLKYINEAIMNNW